MRPLASGKVMRASTDSAPASLAAPAGGVADGAAAAMPCMRAASVILEITCMSRGSPEALMYLLLKFVLSAAIVVAVSEIARRSTFIGALVASLPLTSVLAMIWLYHEGGDASRVAGLSREVFWLVLPSLLLFVTL